VAVDTQARTDVTHYKNYIGGEWVDAASGGTFDVVNPATEEVFATVPSAGREDAQRAIAAAREAFDSGVWSGMEPEERKRILLSVVEKFSEFEDDLATMETMQAGMTIRATSTVVIGYCINHWDYFANHATRPAQQPLEPVSYPTHSYNFVLREPIGVCAGIVPWNFPLVMAVW
jgi:acyl-CoA reductase-like NAD-dependent aldehyde dehydrogenase